MTAYPWVAIVLWGREGMNLHPHCIIPKVAMISRGLPANTATQRTEPKISTELPPRLHVGNFSFNFVLKTWLCFLCVYLLIFSPTPQGQALPPVILCISLSLCIYLNKYWRTDKTDNRVPGMFSSAVLVNSQECTFPLVWWVFPIHHWLVQSRGKALAVTMIWGASCQLLCCSAF